MKEENKNESKSRLTYIRLYIIPIFATFIFFGVIIFLVIPKISEIFSNLDEISLAEAQIEQNKTKFIALDLLTAKYSSIVEQIDIINSIAPVGTTEVVKFRDRMTTLINSNNLRILNQRLSELDPEITSLTNGEQSLSGILLQEVPFVFGVEGNYIDLVNFLNQLNSLEDFIVVKEMKMSSVATNTAVWQLSITIVKYQFVIAEDSSVDSVFKSVPTEAKLSEIMQEYIQSRLNRSI